jgi:hypothetical protein
MIKVKKLSRKQLAVLDDLFIGELDEQAVLDKHDVSRNQYYKWLTDDYFAQQFDLRIAASYRQSAGLLAKYATLAAVKLVHLTDSENQETARKACLDVISMQGIARKETKDEGRTAQDAPRTTGEISPETASKILDVLARENQHLDF